MTFEELTAEVSSSPRYTLHCHTQFCDGRSTMEQMAAAAIEAGYTCLGFSPHSPIPLESPCNMSFDDVPRYIAEVERLRALYAPHGLKILAGMEVDYLSPSWNAANSYFASLPLDYLISSVHFIPSQDGEPVDIDGSYDRFARNMSTHFRNDIRYVVERFFNNTLEMLHSGGFTIVGHLDKIAMNAAHHVPGLENEAWYGSLVSDVIDVMATKGYVAEINTKAWHRDARFFPSTRWWRLLRQRGVPVVINSDAHEASLLDAGRQDALSAFLADIH